MVGSDSTLLKFDQITFGPEQHCVYVKGLTTMGYRHRLR